MKLIGEADLQRKLKAKLGAPSAARFLFDAWRFDVERGTKANIVRGPGGWLWKGTTRQSATSERDQSEFPRWARVGSNLDTFRWGELGTGLLSEDPASAHRRYFPPPDAMEPWALAHQFESGFMASLAIFKKGGTEPRHFLKTAFEASEPKIDGWLAQAGNLIEKTAPAL